MSTKGLYVVRYGVGVVAAVALDDGHVDDIGGIVQDVGQLAVVHVSVWVIELDGEARVFAVAGRDDTWTRLLRAHSAQKLHVRVDSPDRVTQVAGDDPD
jgi:hypothetical protein